jgi:hypothetical protein
MINPTYHPKRSSMLRIVGAAITVLLLTACAPTTLNGGPSAGHLQSSDAVKAPGSIPQTLQQSVPLPRPKATAKTETYSVVVNNVKVQDLLFALARDAKLNVDIHPGIIRFRHPQRHRPDPAAAPHAHLETG